MIKNSEIFIPELWSSTIIDSLKRGMSRELWALVMSGRSSGAQLLRNEALGYDETDYDAVMAHNKVNTASS